MNTIQKGTFQLKMLDLLATDWLPSDWLAQINDVITRRAVELLLDGKSVTSREPDNIAPIHLKIVTGEIIQSELGWLFELYAGPLLNWSSTVTGERLEVAVDLESSININIVSGKGNRYERHVDTNPTTGLLFATTLSEAHGGALVFEHASGFCDRICPREGLFLAFDATNTIHYVTPLTSSMSRVSLPMNYYIHGSTQARPPNLNDYLYTNRHS